MKKKIYSPSVEALQEKIIEIRDYIANNEAFLNNWQKLKQDEYDKAEAELRSLTLRWNTWKQQRTETIRRHKEHIDVLKSTIKLLEESH